MLKKLRHVSNLPQIVHLFSRKCLRFDFGVHSCIEKMTLTYTLFFFFFSLGFVCVCLAYVPTVILNCQNLNMENWYLRSGIKL